MRFGVTLSRKVLIFSVVLCDSQSVSNLPNGDSQPATSDAKQMCKMNLLVTEKKEEELDKPHPNGDSWQLLGESNEEFSFVGIRKRVALQNQLLASIRAQRGAKQEERKRTYRAAIGEDENSDAEEPEEEVNSDSEEDEEDIDETKVVFGRGGTHIHFSIFV